MFYYVKGKLVHIAPFLAVIDCGGVGYGCRTTNYTLAQVTKGEETLLYTYFHVREDAQELYGFATEDEKKCFELLISVSGVGPKAALSILSATSPEGLALSIITGDEKALTVAQGIGKKIAQRIILELKDKLAKGQLGDSGFQSPVAASVLLPENKGQEAVAALAVLGYGSDEIGLAMKGIPVEELETAEIIRLVLKKMTK